MTTATPDPMEFLKSFWGKTTAPVPSMVMPTMDPEELNKRINDLKAVEAWLKVNLSMLQVTIQGLEVQAATLGALQSIVQPETAQATKGGTGSKSGKQSNPGEAITNAAMASLNLMRDAMNAATASGKAQAGRKKRASGSK